MNQEVENQEVANKEVLHEEVVISLSSHLKIGVEAVQQPQVSGGEMIRLEVIFWIGG